MRRLRIGDIEVGKVIRLVGAQDRVARIADPVDVFRLWKPPDEPGVHERRLR